VHVELAPQGREQCPLLTALLDHPGRVEPLCLALHFAIHDQPIFVPFLMSKSCISTIPRFPISKQLQTPHGYDSTQSVPDILTSFPEMIRMWNPILGSRDPGLSAPASGMASVLHPIMTRDCDTQTISFEEPLKPGRTGPCIT
jgi:hypothetical protein